MVEQNLEFLNNPNDLWKYKNTILAKVSLMELMTEYGMVLEPKQTGSFTHRTACPFHKGKNGGQERTPSFYIDATNSFFCFGCLNTGNVINFVSQIEGMPLSAALEKLAKRAGLLSENGKIEEFLIDTSSYVCFESIKTIDPLLVEIGSILRSYVKKFMGSKSFEQEFKWAEKVGSKVDGFLVNVGFEDWEYVKDICDKVKLSIKNRIKREKS